MRIQELSGPDDLAAVHEAWSIRLALLKTTLRDWLGPRRTADVAAQEACAPEGAWPSRESPEVRLRGLT